MTVKWHRSNLLLFSYVPMCNMPQHMLGRSVVCPSAAQAKHIVKLLSTQAFRTPAPPVLHCQESAAPQSAHSWGTCWRLGSVAEPTTP